MKSPRGHIILLGGSGFAGKRIVEILLDNSYDVTTVNRGVTKVSYSKEVRRIFSDRKSLASFYKTLCSLNGDAVIDLSAYRGKYTRPVIKAFRGRVGRYIQIGTASVYQLPVLTPVKETWSLVSPDVCDDKYALGKVACEKILEHIDDLSWTVLRVPAIYGPGDPHSRENAFMKAIVRGRSFPLPDGGKWFIQNLYVDELAYFCLKIIEAGNVKSEAINLAGKPFTLKQYIEILCKLLGHENRSIEVDTYELLSKTRYWDCYPYFMTGGNYLIDTMKMRQSYDFVPKTRLEDGLKMCVRSNKEGLQVHKNCWQVPMMKENIPHSLIY